MQVAGFFLGMPAKVGWATSGCDPMILGRSHSAADHQAAEALAARLAHLWHSALVAAMEATSSAVNVAVRRLWIREAAAAGAHSDGAAGNPADLSPY